jgi:hypothetical protein
MFSRTSAATTRYATKLGLARHWVSYCDTVVALEQDQVPKNGLAPLGVTNWRTLDRETFTAYLGALEAHTLSAKLLCLADVKTRLRTAGAEPAP